MFKLLPVRSPFAVGMFLVCSYQSVACGSGATPYQDSVSGGGQTGGGQGGESGSVNGGGGQDSGGASSSTRTWAFSALHVDGNKIKNEAGDDVVLRGVSTIDIGTTQESEGGLIKMIDRLTNRDDAQGSSPGWYTTVVRLAIYPVDSDHAKSPITFQSGSDIFYEKLLKPAVERLKERGAYAIIDWHYIGDTNLHRATTEEFWAYMAPKFADQPNVIYELFNEPVNKSGGWPAVKTDMQSWYDIVRASAKENLVLVGTPSWCQVLAPTAEDPLDGYNIAYVAHIYPMHWKWAETVRGVETANSVHPVFLTEWGYGQSSDSVTHGDQATYGDPLKAWVETQGMSWTAWCASKSWTPPIFDASMNLLVGPDRMGGFTKDWLYEKRNDRSPFGDR
ncbi:MAG: cellulase family glycosylhydrolase [Polyangiaceae bacterium]